MKRRQDVLVRCPYYRGEERQLLCCEGVQDGASIHQGFDTQARMNEYKGRYCKTDYNKCLIAQAMNRKWEYEI